MSGWDVSAFLADRGDVRALRILGVSVVDTGAPPATGVEAADEAMILAVSRAVSRAVYDTDPAVRDIARVATRDNRAEVVLWSHRPAEPMLGTHCRTVRFSAAATVFKAHASAAAGVIDRVFRDSGVDEHLEVLLVQRSAAPRTADTKLTSVGGRGVRGQSVLLSASIEEGRRS